MNDSKLTEKAILAFRQVFGTEPTVVAAAPGRVNLIGEHVDYNDGFVLPFAIDRLAVIAAKVCDDPNQSVSRIHNVDLNKTIDVEKSLGNSLHPDKWINYIAGVVTEYSIGVCPIPAFDAVLISNVPIGAGLSSSAALEVATATMLESLTGTQLERLHKAQLCQKAEHQHVGVPCGLMDQYSSVFGRDNELMLMDCQTLTHKPIRIDSTDAAFIIVNTMVRHDLAEGKYKSRRNECQQALRKLAANSWREITEQFVNKSSSLTQTEIKRARHIISETRRAREMAVAIEENDLQTAGKLMYASHRSLQLDYEVSCSELDMLVELAREIGISGGVYGARMTGAGFGGCTINLVENSNSTFIIDRLVEKYREKFQVRPDVYISKPSRGAHSVPIRNY